MTLTRIALLALASMASTLSACALPALPPPDATMANIQAVRVGGLPPMQVGAFSPAPGAPTEMDSQITVRAGIQPAPGGSYAKYLGEVLAADLKAAGKLDPNTDLVVSGVVVDTHVDSGMPAGAAGAKLAAKFTLVKAGKTVFDKTLSVNAVWNSEFIGAVAIPDAVNHYMGLFPALANKLFTDPDFIAASKAG
ncbi:MAG TPA: hypothetical protein VHY34_10645 [Caulobacteraceae bacterium]|jgi:hypothetical protein|nr:hypothetical protein [Caulobacteraceae bacterium]